MSGTSAIYPYLLTYNHKADVVNSVVNKVIVDVEELKFVLFALAVTVSSTYIYIYILRNSYFTLVPVSICIKSNFEKCTTQSTVPTLLVTRIVG